MANEFATHALSPVDYPFNQRIATPAVAALFWPNPLLGYAAIDLVSAFAFASFVFLTVTTLGLGRLAFYSIILWFGLHPVGAALYFWFPASPDPAAYALLAAVAYSVAAEKLVAAWLTALLALFVKETFLFVMCAMLTANVIHWLATSRRPRLALPLLAQALCVGIALGILRLLLDWPIPAPWHVSSLDQIAYYVGLVIADPFRIVVWVASAVCVLGFFPVLLMNGKWPISRPFLFYLIGGAGYVAFGLIAGGDMTRIILNGSVLTLLAAFMVARERIGIVIALSFAELLSYPAISVFPMLEYAYYTGHLVDRIAAFAAAMLVVYAALLSLRLRGRIVPAEQDARASAARICSIIVDH